MAQDFREFIVYNLHDSGEISEIEVNQDEVQKILDPKEVFMLVRQDLRRIYIWKGSVAPVRKRFISARRATLLQEDIRKSGGRALKIVSVDQGDEPAEFLDSFHLESMQVTEVLEDLRYVRNAERDAEAENPNVAAAPPEGSTAHGTAAEFLPPKKSKAKAGAEVLETPETPPEPEVPEPAPPAEAPETPEPAKVTEAVKPAEPTPVSGAPILFDDADALEPAKEGPAAKPRKEPKKAAPKEEPKRAPIKPKPAVRKVKAEPTPVPPAPAVPPRVVAKATPAIPAASSSKVEEDALLKEILAKPAPEGTKRINIIIGNKLIGSIVQQKNILGKAVESTVWGQFAELPTGCAEIKGIVRIYTDQAKGIVVATDLIQSNPEDKIEVKGEEKASGERPDQILAEVSKVPLPEGFKRLNVLLGTQLYGCVTQQKSVLGKSVEKFNWELISDLPGGCTELQGLIRIFVDAEKGIVKAVDILEGKGAATNKSEEKSEVTADAAAPAEESTKKHRELPEIPKGES